MTTTIPVIISGLYPAQRPIVEHPAKVKVLRCGRRFGKTQLAVHEAVMCLARKGKVGWFAPETQYADEAWSRLKRALGDAVVGINGQKRTMEVQGGGQMYMYTMESNEDPGRGQDFDMAIIDEAGLCPNIDEIYDRAIEPTLLDRNGTLYVLGTSKQNGIGFRRLFRRAEIEPGWAAFRAKTLDNPYLDDEAVARVAAARERAVRAGTLPQWEAEYEGGDHDDGASFFPLARIEALAERCTDPAVVCRLDVHAPYAMDRDHAITHRRISQIVCGEGAGDWRLWCDLLPDRAGMRRPEQRRHYVLAADLSDGVGSSNTVFSVGDAESRRKIGQFTASRVTPPEAARLAAIAGLWFGGVDGCASIVFEANGPGEAFSQSLVQLGYPRVMRRSVFGSRLSEERQDAYGWWSSAQAKLLLLTDYREALCAELMVNPSREAVTECTGYRLDDHGRLVTDAVGSTALAKAPHGDMVIADALLWMGMKHLPIIQAREPKPPPGSWGHEREVHADRMASRASRW